MCCRCDAAGHSLGLVYFTVTRLPIDFFWPWKPFQQCPLPWWISVPSFNLLISLHWIRRYCITRNKTSVYGQRTDGRQADSPKTRCSPPTIVAGCITVWRHYVIPLIPSHSCLVPVPSAWVSLPSWHRRLWPPAADLRVYDKQTQHPSPSALADFINVPLVVYVLVFAANNRRREAYVVRSAVRPSVRCPCVTRYLCT